MEVNEEVLREKILQLVITNFDKPNTNREDFEREVEKIKTESEADSARRLQEFHEASERIRQSFLKRRR
jgi:hypothetical protein